MCVYVYFVFKGDGKRIVTRVIKRQNELRTLIKFEIILIRHFKII